MQVLRTLFCRLALCGGLLAWALGSPPAAGAKPSTLRDQGIFEISVAGKPVGTEKFRIEPSGDRLIVQSEIALHTPREGKILTFHCFPKLVLNAQLQPLSYRWAQKGARNSRLEIDFTTAPAKAFYHTVNGKDDRREFLLSRDVVVLDDNVLSQYEILLERYRRTSGGAQVFKAFIPQEALPGQVRIEEMGREPVTLNGRTRSLRHLVVTTDLARIDLWADAAGRLWRVTLPAMHFNAVRRP